MQLTKPDDEFGQKKRAWLERIAAAIKTTADNLAVMAQVVAEIDADGLDPNEVLAELCLGADFIGHLRLIHCGQLDSAFFVTCGHKKRLVNAIVRLPDHDRERIIRENQARVVVVMPDGQKTHRLVPLRELTEEQVNQVFDRTYVRDDNQQASYLNNKQRQAREDIPSSVGVLKLDEDRDGVVHGRTFIPRSDLETAVSLLRRRRQATA